jgi:hypothetical protein
VRIQGYFSQKRNERNNYPQSGFRNITPTTIICSCGVLASSIKHCMVVPPHNWGCEITPSHNSELWWLIQFTKVVPLCLHTTWSKLGITWGWCIKKVVPTNKLIEGHPTHVICIVLEPPKFFFQNKKCSQSYMDQVCANCQVCMILVICLPSYSLTQVPCTRSIQEFCFS